MKTKVEKQDVKKQAITGHKPQVTAPGPQVTAPGPQVTAPGPRVTGDEYAFPTKSRCPRCGGTNTKAVSTQGNRQFRECQTPVCRFKYSVEGTKI
jgi:hypothetical protein